MSVIAKPLKRAVRLLVVPILIGLVRLRHQLLPWLPLRSRTGVLTPAAPGSLGDEAMICGLVGRLLKVHPAPITFLEYHPNKVWRFEDVDSRTSVTHFCIRDYIYGDSVRNLISFVILLFWLERLYVIGADVLDGFYSGGDSRRRIELACYAAMAGVDVRVVGFSWNDSARPEDIEALRQLGRYVQLRARDPVSRNRLERDLHLPVVETRDVAFLLEPSPLSAESVVIRNWIEEQKRLGRSVVVLNISSHLVGRGKLPADPESFTRFFVDAVLRAETQLSTLSLVLCHHDTRGENSDLAMSRLAYSLMPESIKARTILTPDTMKASDVKAIVSDVDAAFGGRMHLAIACLGQCTPVGALTYQGKFDGLFSHCGMERFLIDPVHCHDPSVIANVIVELVTTQEACRARINAVRSEFVHMALLNV